MTKVEKILKVASILFTFILIVEIGWNTLDNNEEEKNKEIEMNKKKIELVEKDIQEAEAEIKLLEIQKSELESEIEIYTNLDKKLSEEKVNQLLQNQILKCYKENIILAIEAKTLAMESFGVEVPADFSNGKSAMEEYTDYISETVVDSVLSEIASEDVQDILKGGIDGAVEVYHEQGGLADIAKGALSSVVEGVGAKIQSAPLEMAVEVLDETTGGLASVVIELEKSDSIEEYLANLADKKTGGLVGSISGIVSYDMTPKALLQNLSYSADVSSEEVKKFLNSESVKSEDIAEMMYYYSQFGNTMDALGQYGGTVDFEWESNYEKMELIYERFIYNETMIQLISNKGEGTNE